MDKSTNVPSNDQTNEAWNIPLKEFSEIVDSGNIPVVDVRENDEIATVHVDAKNFIHIPLKQFENALNMDKDTFMATYNAAKPSPGDELALICRSGRRSKLAIEIAKANNYPNARHFDEGTNGWIKHFPDRVVTSTAAE